MTNQSLKPIIEAALFAAGKPLMIDHFLNLFVEAERPERSVIRAILRELGEDYADRGIELVQVASGYRFQTKQNLIPWLKRLQPERPPRYSRSLLETLAIIAYRQPITRGEIEGIRGVNVSTDIVKKLQDYNWIRVLAHRETPGRPALYGTTREFLNYFNLKNLNDLPPLIELQAQAELFESNQINISSPAPDDVPESSEKPESDEKDNNPVAEEVLESEEDTINTANQPESENTDKEDSVTVQAK